MKPPSRPPSEARDDPPDALLEEALFGNAHARRLARARLHAAGRLDELLALETALARSADELRALTRMDGPRERRFVARVLAATTRRDPSWRGDLSLLLDFLRARLRASPALRLVAASLVLHLVAGPVLAYWVLRSHAPERRVTIHVELPSEEPFANEPPPPPADDDELLRHAREREARENARARERFVLGERGPGAPLLDGPPPEQPELALLQLRGGFLRDPRGTSTDLGPPPSSAQAFALTLWVESALDRFVLREHVEPSLGLACQVLSQLVGLSEGTARLARRAVERARSLGWLPAEEGVPEGQDRLLDAAWFEAFALAGAENGLASSATWQAWAAFAPHPQGVILR